MSQTLSYTAVALRAQQLRPAFHVAWHPELMQYAASFHTAASETAAVDSCMLAAIVLRESGGQNILQIGMQPGPECGVGICQITYNVDWSNLLTPSYPGYGSLLDPNTNLRVAASVFLDPLLTIFPGNHIAAFAAYNCGPSAVENALRSGRTPDSVTTNKNYGSDVFKTWINFTAASMGVHVSWAGYSGNPPHQPSSQTTQVVTGATTAPSRTSVPAQGPADDLTNF